MKSSYKQIGQCIRIVDERNRSSEVSDLLGININKSYIPTVANMTDLDLTNYKIVRNNRFACNIMHVGRDERLPVSLYTRDIPALISPAYTVFESIDEENILPEYLMMIFQRPEFDRFTWFVSDSSIRGGLEWDRFCEIEIPVPKVDEQRDVVSAYNSLLKNQNAFSRTLSDMQLICDSFMENLASKGDVKELGKYIRQSDVRNNDLNSSFLRGISTSKIFIRSLANTTNLNLDSYKLVNKRQFAYVADTSRRGDKIGLAMCAEEKCIISSIYTVFEVIDETILLPEFLLLWFKRSDFDRYARFHSWGSARETFNWEDMCSVKLPVPDIDTQKSIVAIHHALESRKRINTKLIDMITPLCTILMKGVVDRSTTN